MQKYGHTAMAILGARTIIKKWCTRIEYRWGCKIIKLANKKSAMPHHYICIKMHFLWILNNKCVIFTSMFMHVQLFHMLLETVIHSINSNPVQYYTYTNSTEKILWIEYVKCVSKIRYYWYNLYDILCIFTFSYRKVYFTFCHIN